MTATVCLPQARVAIASFLRTPVSRVSTAASTGSNAMPQCSFAATIGARNRVALTANVDTSPSPYFRLERTAVEADQMFAPTGAAPAPQPVSRLGLDAYWFPDRMQLMSTDGVRLLTVTVGWRHSGQARKQALAEAASRPYLRTPRGQAASSLAKGAPAPA